MSVASGLFGAISAQLQSADFQKDSALQQLEQCWLQGQSAWFVGQQHCRLHFRYWLTPNATAALVLVPGRIEAAHKYLEVCLDAVKSGYQVFVLDHRGQGISERLCDDPQVGMVDDFVDYQHDLALWFAEVRQITTLPLVALGHSMGGAILAGYLQNSPLVMPHAAIFCSPMWGLTTAPFPPAVARVLATAISQLNRTVSSKCWYGPGQGPYTTKPFFDNDLTTCEPRYQWFRALYQRHPEYQIGGASWHWIAAAFRTCQAIAANPAPHLPMLLLQAEAERVVSNQAQDEIWAKWRATKQADANQATHLASNKVVIPQAQHELLCAEDWQRQQVYQAINDFLSRLGFAK